MSDQNTYHDSLGRFVAGNPGGPGRPANPRKHQYTDALASRITADSWNEIIDRAIKDAIGGDHRARVWLTDHLMGRPTQTLSLRGMDAALLADVLAVFSAQGISPADIFQAMLDEVSDEKPFDSFENVLPSGE